jgi:hypothetical protein
LFATPRIGLQVGAKSCIHPERIASFPASFCPVARTSVMPFEEVVWQLLAVPVGQLQREGADSVIDHSTWQFGIQVKHFGKESRKAARDSVQISNPDLNQYFIYSSKVHCRIGVDYDIPADHIGSLRP